MPRWEVHLTTGLGASVVITFGFLMGLYDGAGLSGLATGAGGPLPFLLLGLMALLVGSVVPDLDGKGKVKLLIGPIAGTMALAPLVVGTLQNGSVNGAMGLLNGTGARLFLFSCAVGYTLLLVPFRHRGVLHSHRAALIFGTLWGAYLVFQTLSEPSGPILAGSMGCLGYAWHLALDGRL